jgi:hypothetical protein
LTARCGTSRQAGAGTSRDEGTDEDGPHFSPARFPKFIVPFVLDRTTQHPIGNFTRS